MSMIEIELIRLSIINGERCEICSNNNVIHIESTNLQFAPSTRREKDICSVFQQGVSIYVFLCLNQINKKNKYKNIHTIYYNYIYTYIMHGF